MKTAEDIMNAVKQHDIARWQLRECSICYYPLCFFFEGGRVLYDIGCSCTNQADNLQEDSYAGVAKVFNTQTPEVADRMWKEFIASGFIPQ